AGPFEAMVAVTEAAGGQAGPVRIVLGVGGGDDHPSRPGMGEDDLLQRAQAWTVDVLDDLNQQRGVESGESVVAVNKGALDQIDSRAPPLRHRIKAQVPLRAGERLGGDVDANDLLDLPLV